MTVAIVKYNAGNIYSVIHALQRLGVEPVLTDDAETLRKADKVIFPGQGEASNAMQYLREHGLDEVIRSLKNPILGICIGQQLMCRHSEEGNVDCLGIFDVDVVRFQPQRHEDKVPHMGWNTISCKGETLEGSEGLKGLNGSEGSDGSNGLKSSNGSESLKDSESICPLFKGFKGNEYVYFVHSYYVPLCPDTAAVTDYILPFSAAMHRDNFYATQFHPEKSGSVGERILKNFLEL